MATKPTSTKKEKKSAAAKQTAPKLRIRVQAYEHKALDVSVKQIVDTSIRLNATVVGPIPLPTKIKKYTVNRSTFIFKDSREQLEIRTHRRLIDILNPSRQVVEALGNLTIPAGVSVDVRTI